MDSRKSLSTAVSALQANSVSIDSQLNVVEDILPNVYLTDGTEYDEAIHHIIVQFSLNVEQTRAFRIPTYHSLGISKLGNQLLMGLFGEAGTGKSRVVNAIHAWFAYLNWSDKLVVTATIGTAAFNICGETLHSALGITVE
jgi:hypothetical protein